MFGEGKGVVAQEHAVTLRHGRGSYRIAVKAGLLSEVGQRMAAHGLAGGVLVVTNPTVERNYGHRLISSLRAGGFRPQLFVMPDGEEFKSVPMATSAWERALEMGLDRSSTVLGFGGGVVCDLAGFVAATYMRGVPFVQVPTTLLAQVDASVGGKVAVNLPSAKNAVGVFYQPQAVFIDPLVLATLERREVLSGMGEVVKHGAILDVGLFERLERFDDSVLFDPEAMAELIALNVQIKSCVVEEDETERGLRAVLNFGHTLGHAIESLTAYRVYRHGEGVSIGMVCAARLSRELGLLPVRDLERLEGLLTRLGMPTTVDNSLRLESIVSEMRKDKKTVAGEARFVLLEGLGRARSGVVVPPDCLSRVLTGMGVSE